MPIIGRCAPSGHCCRHHSHSLMHHAMQLNNQSIWTLVIILALTAVVTAVVQHFVRRELVQRYPFQDPYAGM